MMPKLTIALAALVAWDVYAFADYVADREAAMNLINAGKYEEALATFTRMAAGKDAPDRLRYAEGSARVFVDKARRNALRTKRKLQRRNT